MSDPISTYAALEITIKDARKARAAIKQLKFARGRTVFSTNIPEPEGDTYLALAIKEVSDHIIDSAIKKAQVDLLDAGNRIMALAEQLREQDPT